MTTSPPKPPSNLPQVFTEPEAYLRLTGGWPADIAQHIITSISPSITPSSTILDNACGTGIISSTILHDFKIPATVHAVDINQSMVSYVRQHIPNITSARVMNSESLDFPDEAFSHCINSFGVFFCQDSKAALGEMYRTLKKDGIVVVSSWKEVGYASYINYVKEQIKPEQADWRFPVVEEGWMDDGWIKEVLENVGFREVQVRKYTSWSYQRSLEELAEGLLPFCEGFVRGWTEEERGRWEELFVEGARREGAQWDEGKAMWKVPMLAWIAEGRK